MRRTSSRDVLTLVTLRTMVKNAEQMVNRTTVAIKNEVRFLDVRPDSPMYSIWPEMLILFATVMIVAGLRKAYSRQGVLDLIDRRTRSRRVTLAAVITDTGDAIIGKRA